METVSDSWEDNANGRKNMKELAHSCPHNDAGKPTKW